LDACPEKPRLLVVTGPTACGKTGLAAALCRRLGGEVVSADSMQIYRGMEIATAQPTPEETDGVPHHLVGFRDPAERFSVQEYAALAHAAIREIAGRGRLPVLAGGTGLYIQAVTEGLTLTEGETDFALRDALRRRAEAGGRQALWDELSRQDSQAAQRIHPNDTRRLVRALELFAAAGVTVTEQNERSRQDGPPYDCRTLVILPRNRQSLYDRIDARVEEMLDRGMKAEAARFFAAQPGPTAVQAIGYKELAPYFSGEISLAQAAENLKQETRRYAKRQLSWLRRAAVTRPGPWAELAMDSAVPLLDQALAALAQLPPWKFPQ
jgi:tRNA dimethylallyltransferase